MTASETWSVGPEHLVTCPVVVPAGLTLTIAPGVVVRATTGAGILADGSLGMQQAVIGAADAPLDIQVGSGAGLSIISSRVNGSVGSASGVADSGSLQIVYGTVNGTVDYRTKAGFSAAYSSFNGDLNVAETGESGVLQTYYVSVSAGHSATFAVSEAVTFALNRLTVQPAARVTARYPAVRLIGENIRGALDISGPGQPVIGFSGSYSGNMPKNAEVFAVDPATIPGLVCPNCASGLTVGTARFNVIDSALTVAPGASLTATGLLFIDATNPAVPTTVAPGTGSTPAQIRLVGASAGIYVAHATGNAQISVDASVPSGIVDIEPSATGFALR